MYIKCGILCKHRLDVTHLELTNKYQIKVSINVSTACLIPFSNYAVCTANRRKPHLKMLTIKSTV